MSDTRSETVDYAAAVVLEVRTSPSSPEPFLRLQFKNGTDDAELHTYPLSFPGWDGTSGTDVPLSTFIAAFQPVGINTTLEWCNACGQTTARGCDVALAAAQSGVTQSALAARANFSDDPAPLCGPHRMAAAHLGGMITMVLLFMLVSCLMMARWRHKDHSAAKIAPDDQAMTEPYRDCKKLARI